MPSEEAILYQFQSSSFTPPQPPTLSLYHHQYQSAPKSGRKYQQQRQNKEGMAETENLVVLGESHKSVIERYYTPKYYTDKTKGKDKDICILTHSNKMENTVGAQSLGPKSKLCIITCENGKEYTIDCGIRSQLIEVNENLIENPDLLLKK
ncbi:hypothetical protein KUTeg_008061, partial [Tegillarca granosa]